MLGYNDLLSKPSIELNTIWEPIIKKARWKKNLNMSSGKKQTYIIVVILVSKNIKFISAKNSLWNVQQDIWRNDDRRWLLKLLRQSSGGCSFNTDCRLVTIQEYLTLLPGYESEQLTPVDSIKDVVRSSVKVPQFDKHLKKAGGHIDRNVVEIINMKTRVWKPLMIKIIKLCLRNLDN